MSIGTSLPSQWSAAPRLDTYTYSRACTYTSMIPIPTLVPVLLLQQQPPSVVTMSRCSGPAQARATPPPGVSSARWRPRRRSSTRPRVARFRMGSCSRRGGAARPVDLMGSAPQRASALLQGKPVAAPPSCAAGGQSAPGCRPSPLYKISIM